MEVVRCSAGLTSDGLGHAQTDIFPSISSGLLVCHELPQAIMDNGIYELVGHFLKYHASNRCLFMVYWSKTL